MEEYSSEQDKMRLCPTCRMPISVWATKCRYCGAEVGRPRKETPKLTVEDLGGADPNSFELSSSVASALEAFREEQLSAQEEEERRKTEAAAASWFGRRQSPAAAAPKRDDLPELDETHRQLAAAGEEGGAHSQGSSEASPSPEILRNLAQVGAVFLGVLIVGLAGLAAWHLVGDYLTGRNASTEVVYENKALAMLEAGKPTVDALAEALTAARINNTEENRRILDQVEARVLKQAEKLINSVPWNREHLNEASRLATRAWQIHPSPAIKNLLDEVSAEVAAYKLVLVRINPQEGRATFKLHDPALPQTEQPLEAVDHVADRASASRIS